MSAARRRRGTLADATAQIKAMRSGADTTATPAEEVLRTKSANPPEKPPAGQGTTMAAFRLPTDLAEELRGAAKALEADQALIVREALERELTRLRRKYQDGEPFPRVGTGKRRTKL